MTITASGFAICRRCGRPYRTRESDPTRIHRACRRRMLLPLLGDRLAVWLGVVGITKRLAEEFARNSAWLAPDGAVVSCGCGGRQQAANRAAVRIDVAMLHVIRRRRAVPRWLLARLRHKLAPCIEPFRVSREAIGEIFAGFGFAASHDSTSRPAS